MVVFEGENQGFSRADTSRYILEIAYVGPILALGLTRPRIVLQPLEDV